jgi:hypothetical protein
VSWWKPERADVPWRHKVEPYLEPDELIESVFGAFRARAINLVVVATDRRIVLIKVKFSGVIDSVTGELPRSTRFGPPHGLFSYRPDALGGKERVSRIFWKEIREADEALDSHAVE